MTDRAQKIQTLIIDALNAHQDETPRTKQSNEGILGPSDIGFCRQKAALMTKGIAPTDRPPKWAAAVGTAIHDYVERALKDAYPDWIVGSIDKLRVTATLPSGAMISGHPDIVVRSANAVLDIKTVDGFEWIKREGTSKQHKFQRHLYALGLLQADILTDATPLLVGNIYFDRSGKEPTPIVLVEELNPELTEEVDTWVQDVIYAVNNGEDASRDVPSAVCERICSHFTACRGGLEIYDGAETITDPTLLTAVDMYVEARDLEKHAAAMKKSAQQQLLGVNGSTGQWQIRWVEVAPTRVEAFEKSAYVRLDVRKTR